MEISNLLIPTDESKGILRKYEEICRKIKDLIIPAKNNSDCFYKIYMKIKFDSDDDLHPKKALELYNIIKLHNKTTNKFQSVLPRHFLITIYKTFIRPHLDYGDVIYDRAFNESFHQRLEFIQYNAAIAITGTIRETSSEKLCHN